MQHIAVQEQQRRLGLILGGRRDFSLHRQITQKALNIVCPHILGVTFIVEKNETTGPIQIGLFGADTIVTHAYLCAHPVEQFGRILSALAPIFLDTDLG